jgi:hypothetical protein
VETDMMNLLPLAAGAALLALAAPAAAQPALGSMAARDGIQTRGEAVQRVRTLFARADADRDGAITQAEAQALAGPARAGARRGGARAQLFDRLDTNRDNMLSREEWARAEALRAERRAGRGDQRRQRLALRGRLGGAMLRAADTNRDSRVTLQEAEGAALQRFDRADLNRDGQITAAERQQLRQQRQERRGEGRR